MANSFGFRAVGQGLFYTGSILDGEYKFVYDCGTENKKCYIEREVRRFSARCRKRELEFVVLSHLHRDHFSGLIELMKYFRVKKIFLPYLGANRNLTELVFANSAFGERDDNEANLEENHILFRFVQDLYNDDSVIMGAEKIFLGRESDERDSDSEFVHTHLKFTLPEVGKPYWEFHLLNKKYNAAIMKRLGDKVDELLKNNGVSSISELIYDNKIGLIKKIYEEVFGTGNKLNATSTMLVHFPVEFNKCFRFAGRSDECICARECFHADRAVTLLTGDAEADRREIAILNSILIDGRGILQVPHHGSLPNWESLGNVRDYFDAMVISAGLGNRHGLPSTETVDDILLNRNARLYNVNQNQGCYYSIIKDRRN